MMPGTAMWAAPVGTALGDPGWRLLGHTVGDTTYTVEDEEPIDIEALRRGLTGGRVVTGTFTMTRRQMRILFGDVFRPRRPRRRNPLHAVRDRLRRHHRERFHGRR